MPRLHECLTIKEISASEEEKWKTAKVITYLEKGITVFWHCNNNDGKICFGRMIYQGQRYYVFAAKRQRVAKANATDFCWFVKVPEPNEETKDKILTCTVYIAIHNVGKRTDSSGEKIPALMKEVKGFPQSQDQFSISQKGLCTETEVRGGPYTEIRVFTTKAATIVKKNLTTNILIRARKGPEAQSNQKIIIVHFFRLQIRPPLSNEQMKLAREKITGMVAITD